jgi:hypothetical protein
MCQCANEGVSDCAENCGLSVISECQGKQVIDNVAICPFISFQTCQVLNLDKSVSGVLRIFWVVSPPE